MEKKIIDKVMELNPWLKHLERVGKPGMRFPEEVDELLKDMEKKREESFQLAFLIKQADKKIKEAIEEQKRWHLVLTAFSEFNKELEDVERELDEAINLFRPYKKELAVENMVLESRILNNIKGVDKLVDLETQTLSEPDVTITSQLATSFLDKVHPIVEAKRAAILKKLPKERAEMKPAEKPIEEMTPEEIIKKAREMKKQREEKE